MRYLFQALIAILLLSLGNFSYAQCDGVIPLLCDADGDRDIDSDDIAAIGAANGETVEPGDIRDIDGDGVITGLDARQCVARCDQSACSNPSSGESLVLGHLPSEEAEAFGNKLRGVAGEDSNGNVVKVFFPNSASEPVVWEAVDLGDIPYSYVTNGVIRIVYPEAYQGRQLVAIKPAEHFDYVYQFSEDGSKMKRLPFVLTEDGSVLLRLLSDNANIYIALVK